MERIFNGSIAACGLVESQLSMTDSSYGSVTDLDYTQVDIPRLDNGQLRAEKSATSLCIDKWS